MRSILLLAAIASQVTSLDLRLANVTDTSDAESATVATYPDYPAPSPYSASMAGSAAITFMGNNRPKIYNFNVHVDGRIIFSKYVENERKYKNYATPFKDADTDKSNSIVAVQYKEGTPDHKIHIFYTVDGLMLSGIWTESTETWSVDSNFNSKQFQGNPRAAVAYISGTTPSLRIYFIKNLLYNQDKKMWTNELWEIQLEKDVWEYGNRGSPLRQFLLEGEAAFNYLAAVAWTADDGPQLRVYFLETVKDGKYTITWLREFSSRFTGIWSVSQSWIELAELTQNSLTAITWSTETGRRIRIYRHIGTSAGNRVHEYAKDADNGQWTDKDLPKDLITETDGAAQTSVIVWRTDGGSSTHLRYYQYIVEPYPPPRKVAYYITESSFDTPSDWKAKTGYIYTFSETQAFQSS